MVSLNSMFNNILIIPPCITYGDTFSIIPLIYLLLDYYQNIFLYFGEIGDKNIDY
jgi:hypothetical protein